MTDPRAGFEVHGAPAVTSLRKVPGEGPTTAQRDDTDAFPGPPPPSGPAEETGFLPALTPPWASARAYVATPVSPENALFLAIHWIFHQHETLTWRSIGVLIPDPDRLRALSSLRRLTVRGVKIGTIDQALDATSFQGVLIAYDADRRTLAQAQDVPGVMGLVATATTNAALQPWIDAYHPEHLGGEILHPAEPLVPEPQVRCTLAHVTRHLRLQPNPPPLQEIPAIPAGLRRLRRQGRAYTADELLAAALRLNWPSHTAWELHQLATDILATTPPPTQPRVEPARQPLPALP